MTKAISKMNKQIESIDDMHRFIESFPSFVHQSGSWSQTCKSYKRGTFATNLQNIKHLLRILLTFGPLAPLIPSSQLSKIINEKSLMTVSRAEQEVGMRVRKSQRNPVYIYMHRVALVDCNFCYVRSDRVLAFDLVMDLLATTRLNRVIIFQAVMKNKWTLLPDFAI